MTFQIKKSDADQFRDGFAVAVAAHVHELKLWREHMKRVEEDVAAEKPFEEAHAPFPRPIAPDQIEAAIDEHGEADFDIVDDGPSPEEILLSKKAVLEASVAAREQDLIESIFPRLRSRLVAINYNEALMRDHDRAESRREGVTRAGEAFSELANAYANKPRESQGIFARAIKAIVGKPIEKEEGFSAEIYDLAVAENNLIDAVTASNLPQSAGREEADDAVVSEYESAVSKIETVKRWAAEQLYAIHDLDAESIETWSMSPEPTF